MEGLEQISFQIISYAGMAKTKSYEALQAYRAGDYKKGEELLKETNDYFVEAHKIHAQLIQKEANNEHIDVSILLIHAEDQLMNAENTNDLIKEMIQMQIALNKLSN